MFCRESLLVVPFTFQISTSVHLILAKMVLRALILLEVTAVIVKKDILETTVKQVRTTWESGLFQFHYFFKEWNFLNIV